MINQLDFYFPFFVLGYGSIMTFATNPDFLRKLPTERMDPQVLQWFSGHRTLGFICFGVGFLWSMQRLLITGFHWA